MDALLVATELERWVSLAIAFAGLALSALSFIAWRRERARRMAVVTLGYAAFALFGLLIFSERLVARLLGAANAEVIEHGAGVFVLAGLAAFFLALARE